MSAHERWCTGSHQGPVCPTDEPGGQEETSAASQPVMTPEQFTDDMLSYVQDNWHKTGVRKGMIKRAEAYAREALRGREAELATVVAELNSEILRGDNNFAEAEKYKFRAEAAEAQVRELKEALLPMVDRAIAHLKEPYRRNEAMRFTLIRLGEMWRLLAGERTT
jgi:hypothetical protein